MACESQRSERRCGEQLIALKTVAAVRPVHADIKRGSTSVLNSRMSISVATEGTVITIQNGHLPSLGLQQFIRQFPSQMPFENGKQKILAIR
jgi:hypothetical protein